VATCHAVQQISGSKKDRGCPTMRHSPDRKQSSIWIGEAELPLESLKPGVAAESIKLRIDFQKD
jgi:hypothetical protein